jgi:hypothetical protein
LNEKEPSNWAALLFYAAPRWDYNQVHSNFKASIRESTPPKESQQCSSHANDPHNAADLTHPN